MKALAAIFMLTTTPAWAHLGHLGEAAGHGHWIAAGALGAAALAAWLAGKGKGDQADAEKEGETEEQTPEGAEA